MNNWVHVLTLLFRVYFYLLELFSHRQVNGAGFISIEVRFKIINANDPDVHSNSFFMGKRRHTCASIFRFWRKLVTVGQSLYAYYSVYMISCLTVFLIR